MKIGFIGAGMVGASLGIYFKEKGIAVQGYFSRTKASAEQAASSINAKVYDDIASLVEENSIIWITTNDDAIETVAKEIESYSLDTKKTFVHASGLLTSETLDCLEAKGHHICSAHPLLAFSSVDLALKLLPQTYFFIEGSVEGKKIITNLINKLSNNFVTIKRENKAAYHTGAVIASNYLVTLIHAANQAFNLAAIENEDLRPAVKVLLESALENISHKETKDALTGPIKRGDANTVATHVKVLDEKKPELAKFYRFMALETMKMLGDYRLKAIIEK